MKLKITKRVKKFDTFCSDCDGFIPRPHVAYGYSGKFCVCDYSSGDILEVEEVKEDDVCTICLRSLDDGHFCGIGTFRGNIITTLDQPKEEKRCDRCLCPLHPCECKDQPLTPKDIMIVCKECGISANVLTCLKKYGMPPKELAFGVSTFHRGVCDYCGEQKYVTQTRDFFHPDFILLQEYKDKLK